MSDPVKVLAIESWTLYAIGIVLIGLRIVSRRIALGGFSKLQIDDWIMLFIVITYTGDVISVNQVMINGSNYLPPGVAEQLSPAGVKNAIWGSKMTLALEEFQLTTTWLVKACLLIMYNRLTHYRNGLPKEHLIVKCVAAYCIFGYIITQVLYLAVWCRPIQEYWRVPVKYPQCASYYNHMITATVFNVSSDLIMLCIPIPLIAKTQLPLKRKLILCGVFSLGIFVVLTAILNRYYNFTSPYSPIFLNWYIGEAATAVYIANVPLLWPLLKSLFKLDTWSGSRGSRRTTGAGYGGTSGACNSTKLSQYRLYKGSKPHASQRLDSRGGSLSEGESGIAMERNGRDGSQEAIVPDRKVTKSQGHDAPLELAPYGFRTRSQGPEHNDVEKGEIVKTVEISVESRKS